MESPLLTWSAKHRVPSLLVPWRQLLGKRSTRGCGFDRWCIFYKGHSQNVSLKVRFSPKAEGVPAAEAVPYNLCTQKPMWDVMLFSENTFVQGLRTWIPESMASWHILVQWPLHFDGLEVCVNDADICSEALNTSSGSLRFQVFI